MDDYEQMHLGQTVSRFLVCPQHRDPRMLRCPFLAAVYILKIWVVKLLSWCAPNIMCLCALQYPILAAVSALVYNVAKIVYFTVS